MPTLEDSVRAKLYRRFIDENPSTIIIERGQRVKTAAGGYVWIKTGDVAPQVGRLIYSGNKGDKVTRILPDGAILVITHTLVFMPGADVERLDKFTLDGRSYLIAAVARVPTWRVACEVGRRDG